METVRDIVTLLAGKSRSALQPPRSYPAALKTLNDSYGTVMPDELMELYGIGSEGFLEMEDGECWRLLSLEEIVNAPEELHVDFPSIRKMPVFDCKDNTFLCYDFTAKEYQFYNIIDEISFDEAAGLREVLLNRLHTA